MNRFVYLNKWPGRRVPRNVVFGKGPRVYVRVCVCVCVCVKGSVCGVWPSDRALPSSQGKAQPPRPQLFIYRLHYCLFEDYRIGRASAQDVF